MNGVSLLRCICDETRFEILELLQKNKELCVNDFVEKLEKDQPLVSHHLKTLKKCGIVKSRDEGKNVKVEVIMREEKLQDVVEEISRTLFANFAIVLYVSDVGVLRPEKF